MNYSDYITSVTDSLTAEVQDTYGRDFTALPHAHVYASARQRCTRRMCYESLVPSLRPRFTTDVLARLGRGKARERDLNILLSRAGARSKPPFDVEGGQQRIEIMGRQGQLLISGKIEGYLNFSGTHIDYEIKAWAPHFVDRIDRFSDILENHWTWPAAFQLLAYLFAKNHPVGFFVLDRPGMPKLIPVVLEEWYSEMEEFLRQAESVNKTFEVCSKLMGVPPTDPSMAMAYIDSVVQGDLLPPFTTEFSNCQRCPFMGSVCQPPFKSDGAGVIEDEELETALAVAVDTKAQHSAYERAWKLCKDRLKGVERAIVGPFVTSGHYQAQNKVDIPKEIAKQYTRKDDHARFLIEIVDTREKPQPPEQQP